jgi:hypothetical protein
VKNYAWVIEYKYPKGSWDYHADLTIYGGIIVGKTREDMREIVSAVKHHTAKVFGFKKEEIEVRVVKRTWRTIKKFRRKWSECFIDFLELI